MLYLILYCNILNHPNGIKVFQKLQLKVHVIMDFSMLQYKISFIHTIMYQKTRKSKSRFLNY